MKLPRTRTTLARYAISYTSVALLSCAILGLALFFVSVRELNSSTRQEQQRKLALACEYVDSQIEIMRDISYRVQTTHCYKPSFFSQNKYDEITLLQDFESYKNYTPFTSDYFLMYAGSDYIFKASSTNDFRVYMRDIHRITSPEALRADVAGLNTFAILTSDENDGVLFFCFPVRFPGTEGDATLCFSVQRADITSVIERTIGRFPGALSIRVDGVELGSAGASFTGDLSASYEGVTCSLDSSGISAYERLNDYRMLAALLIIAIAVVMLLVAVYLSFRSYHPIHELVRRSESMFKVGPNGTGDIEYISDLLDTAFTRAEDVGRQLSEELDRHEEQRRVIRSQLVQLILSGKTGADLGEQLKYVGVRYANPSFYVAAVITLERPARQTGRAMAMVDNLSDDDLLFCATEFRDGGGFAVLMIMEEPGRAQEAIELIEAVMEEAGLNGRISAGFVTEAASDVPKSLMTAISAAAPEPTGERPGAERLANTLRYSDIALPQLCAEIQNANTRQALDIFSRLTGQMKKNQMPASVERCVYSSLLSLLFNIVEKNKLDVPRDSMGELLMSEDMERLRSETGRLIEEVCARNEMNLAGAEKAVSKEIIRYIGEHAGRYDISLGSMAEVFELSERQISRIIKDVTGLAYKEYLTVVRITRACTLLTEENLSVVETCERVGFANVSHFIRVFKNMTDYTPASYKRRMGS